MTINGARRASLRKTIFLFTENVTSLLTALIVLDHRNNYAHDLRQALFC